MDNKALWQQILVGLSEEIARPNLITWFQGSAILSLKDGVLVIGLPREIFVSWHLKNSRKKIEKIAQGYEPSVRQVEFLVDGSLDNKDDPRVLDLLTLFPNHQDEKTVRKLPRVSEVKMTGGMLSRMLNSRFTLANFIEGPENRLAHAAAEAVAKAPGKKYNPLFIYGGVGLGKTHLLHAIGNEILRTQSRLIVAFTSAENFFAEFIELVRNQQGDKFREKWRRADVFIIDDIQFIAGKERTEEAFFHLFNDLYDANKQIIISSDKPPSELKDMSKRLVSRFSMGMIADLYFPSFETRVAILQQKAQEAGVVLDMDLLSFIAENVHHSVRELEGILMQIVALIDLRGELPTKKSVGEIIKRVNRDLRLETVHSEEMPGDVRDMGEIIERVGEFFSVTKLEILGSNRSREYVVPRQVAMWFAKRYLKLSLQKIGSYFGGRDHTSVMNSISRVNAMKKTDPDFWRNINRLRKEMGF